MHGLFPFPGGRSLKRVLVVGSGAGGAAAARELQGRFQVTVLEEGREFKPFTTSLRVPGLAKRAGLLFDPREISLLFPAMRVHMTGEGMAVVRARGTGGTTTIATANALRQDHGFRELGIDLAQAFSELETAIPITTDHVHLWRHATNRCFGACRTMGLDPFPTPKMGRFKNCRNCGRCVLGCPFGVKWDSREFLREAVAKGARLETGARVESIVTSGGEATGVMAGHGLKRRFHPADLVVLAAGGLGTPRILGNSGIEVEPRLFVDPVLCVAAHHPGAFQNSEIPMPFIIQRPGYIVSPYFDHLSSFFNRTWKQPFGDIFSLMIKLADTPRGFVERRSIEKSLTPEDRGVLSEAVGLCREILLSMGIPEELVFLGTMNAGHPGGTLPFTPAEARKLHHERLPGNVYVADSSLFPDSLGNPPMLTILALAITISRRMAGDQF